MISLNINAKEHNLDIDDSTRLLWAIREHTEFTGPKFGCGISQCGACTVLIDGKAEKSCVIKANKLAGKKIITIEGLSKSTDHPVQKAWIEGNVPQCGYCQGGQILAATSLLSKNPDPNDQEIESAMSGNLCRCGTYPRIKKAIKVAAKNMREGL